MKYTIVFSLSVLIKSVLADSAEFTLKLSSSSSDFDGYSIYIGDDSKVYLDTTGKSCTGIVKDDTTLEINSETMGIGKNFLSLESQSSSWKVAEPFTIVDGVLKLYGSNFHAVPSGEDNQYVLGSINAMGSSSRYEVEIIAEGSDGNAVADFAGTETDSSSSTTASSTTSSTSTSSTEAPTSSTEATTTSSEASSTTSTEAPTTTSTEKSTTSTEASTTFTEESTTSTEESTTSTKASTTSTEVSTTSTEAFTSAEASSSTTAAPKSSSVAQAQSSTSTVSQFENFAVKNGFSAGVFLMGALALL